MYISGLITSIALWTVATWCTQHPFSNALFTPDFKQAKITFNLANQEAVFQDSILVSTNTPDIEVETWSIDRTPTPHFDQQTGNTRPAYKGTGTITVHCTVHKIPENPALLIMHYATTSHKSPQEYHSPITPLQEERLSHSADRTEAPVSPKTKLPERTNSRTACVATPSISELLYNGLHALVATVKKWLLNIRESIGTLLRTSSSSSIQLIMAFVLGILMSLTPCIYPMIPITVGLLGTSAQNSLFKNFILASAYTSGVALVCALLGLIAVTFGAQCGQLACNPFIIVGMASLLIYFGGSMLGWYNLYIPRFLQGSSNTVHKGSPLSAFMLGMASGTIASPCMSPGLALLLTLVAGLNNYFLGFMLLFVFGIGSSIPLLVIGTFSSSIHLLPKAGSWMNEVKKFFGFMLIMTALYYLQAVTNIDSMLLIAAAFCLIYSIIYAFACLRAHTTVTRIYTALITFLLLIPALYVGYIGMLSWHLLHEKSTVGASDTKSLWRENYAQAREYAQQEHKYLLLDFTAEWCSYCVLVDRHILQSAPVKTVLTELVPVKVDGTTDSTEYRTVTKQYKIFGIPSLLLVDPETETVIKSWNSALLEQSPELWVDELRSLIAR